MDPARFTRVDAMTWRIEPRGKMRVPAILYADETLIRDMDDKVYEQAANVATLPGIVGASYVMPDAHWGYSHPPQAPLSPFHWLAACTIATSVARPELFAVIEPVPLSRCRPSSPSAIASLECRCAQNTCGESASQESGALFDHRTSSTVAFIGKPVPWPDGFMSRDRCYLRSLYGGTG